MHPRITLPPTFRIPAGSCRSAASACRDAGASAPGRAEASTPPAAPEAGVTRRGARARIPPMPPDRPPPPLPEPFAGWFARRGWEPHPHQLALLARAGDPATLLIAPTGGGKTLAGFLPSLVELGAAPAAGAAHPLRLAAEGARRRHPPQPRRAARRDGSRHPRRGPHRRHRRRAARAASGSIRRTSC